MLEKKYWVHNEELNLSFYYRSKRKAIRVRDNLNENMTPISIVDEWLLHNIDTGELVR